MALFILLIVIAETTVFVVTTPRRSERFFELYVLGANQLVGGYYPKNNPNLHEASLVTWYIGVTNLMGDSQFIEIRVKLGNQTTSAPDDSSVYPSPLPIVVSFERFLSDRATWKFPFTWSVTKASAVNGSIRILTMQINNETYSILNCSAADGYNFRVIFELWVWQSSTNAFEFGWNNDGELRAAWLQLWFNLTNVGPPPPPA